MRKTKIAIYIVDGILLLVIIGLILYSSLQGFESPWLVILILLVGLIINWLYTYRFFKRKDKE